MNTKQPEALQLAECLEEPDYCTLAQMRRAAALLRTQHAMLERARAALSHSNPSEPIWKTPHRDTLAALNQHLEPK